MLETHVSLEAMFGPFAPLFEPVGQGEGSVPSYLVLLGLRSPSVDIVIDRIALALNADDSAQWVPALLRDANWRPHLVAALAFVLRPTLDPQPLWDAIDRGSWVVPQLVVTAALVDPLFRARVRQRVAATRPEDSPERSAKKLASILAISAELPDLAEWRASLLTDERVRALLGLDTAWNCSDKIVTQWWGALRTAFLTRDRTLTIR